MSRILSSLLVTLLAVTSVLAQPTLEVTPPTVAFGCTLGGEDSTRTIAISNTGSDDVTILGFSTSTSEFVAPIATDVVVRAGATIEETIHFQPLIAGPASSSGSLFIRTAEGDVTVALSGVIGAEPMIGTNPTFLDFGDVAVGGSLELCITVSNPSCREIEVLSAATSDPAFTITQGGFPVARTLDAFAEEPLCITFTPTTAGDIDELLTIQGALGKRATVRLRARGIRSELAVEPAVVDFGVVDIGATGPVVTVDIVNRGTQRASIDPALAVIGANPGDFEIVAPTTSFDLEPGERSQVQLRFRPTALGRREGRIVVANSTEVDPEISLVGTGSRFDVEITPAEVDMGDVFVGSTRLAPDTVIVSNRGTRTVTATATIEGVDNAAFAVFGFVVTPIAPDISYGFGLEFKPDAPRVFRAELVVRFDNGTVLRVPLRGRGLDTSAPRPRRITGDSIGLRVGERGLLRFTIDPPLGPPDTARRVLLRLRLDPLSLYPHRVIATGVTATRSYTGTGIVEVIISSSSEPLELDHFDLEIEGLFTGIAMNRVTIDSIDLGDPRISSSVSPGVVALEGCDIEGTVTLRRAVRIESMSPNPTGASALLRYSSTDRARCRIIALDGRLMSEFEAGASEGVAEIGLPVDELPPGTYVVELGIESAGDIASDRRILQVNR